MRRRSCEGERRADPGGSADVLHVYSQYGRSGASSRVRVFQWLEHVGLPHLLHAYAGASTASVRALISRPAATLRGEAAARWSQVRAGDAVLVHRAATPIGRGEVEARLLRQGHLGVYDFDDAIQWEPPRPDVAHRLFPRAAAAVVAVKAADRVIAGNATLAEWAAGHNHDVLVIPSCVEPGYYVSKSSYELGDPPVIGWIGSASTERYLHAVAPALLEVHRRTGAELAVIGAMTGSPGPLEAMVRRLTWSEMLVHNHTADWDVGIMPLTNGLYERGKCGYKLLQYGAAGLPAVGSPVGVNRDLLAEMGGAAPSSTDEWVDALLEVLDAPADRRREAGCRARLLVESSYSYRAWSDRWCAAVTSAPLREAIGSVPAQSVMDR